MAGPATLLDKVWASHAILVRPDGATLLHIDRHLVHDGSGNAFRMLKEKGLAVRRPDRTFATPDHYVPTLSHDLASIQEPHRRGVVARARRRPGIPHSARHPRHSIPSRRWQ
jgi:3-isopropylmalate/(R)-2-methylmalate dehydratase large subunit